MYLCPLKEAYALNTNRDLNYRLFIQKELDFTRTDIHSEFEKYYVIRSGNVQRVKENFAAVRKDFNKGKGQLSDDPLRNNIYHLVVCAAIVARICVDGGMEHNVAYTLSDIYIRRADKCRDPEEVLDLLGELQVDFAQRMREVKKTGTVSVHVRRTIDYIYDNLHESLTLELLASREGLHPSSLSKLFAKETGVTLKDYIIRAKVTTAENMLKFSVFSLSDISLSLGFSSQSAFTSTFKKITGITPKQYRSMYYSENINQL